MKDLFISLLATSILIICSSPTILAHDYNHTDHKALECYSCVYVQSNTNHSNEGCELPTPPAKYKQTACFGFGDLKVAGEMRHSMYNGSNLHHSGQDSYNVHCVKITGKTHQGVTVIMRGCEVLRERNSTVKKECFQKDSFDFAYPGQGTVRNVEKCYCNNDNCNGSSGLVTFLSISLLVPVLLSFATVSKVY